MNILKYTTLPLTQNVEIGLFFLRIVFGSLMISHGFGKFENLMMGKTGFLDPIGIGSTSSLVLVVFAEFFCAILLVIGLFSRVVLIPLIITMIVAFFIFHGADPLADKELSLTYLVVFIGLFITGPGRYSIDQLIHQNSKD